MVCYILPAQSKDMKLLLFFLLLAVCSQAQPRKYVRQLVVVPLNETPDRLGNTSNYLLMASTPDGIILKQKQTFILRSAWQKEGDSVMNIGQGTISETDGYRLIMDARLQRGKAVHKMDAAIFLVPLPAPGKDSVIFKLARFAIQFRTVTDSSFYSRAGVLQHPAYYAIAGIADAMAADIRYTAMQMLQQSDPQDQTIVAGKYKGRPLFATMQQTTDREVITFLMYVYARPDKYMAHTFKISETYATWLVNGAPVIRAN